MKQILFILIFVSSTGVFGQNDEAFVEAQISQIKAELEMQQVSEYFMRKDFCEGNIQIFKMPNGGMCASTSTYYSVYVFWKSEDKTIVQKVDNCGTYEKITIDDSTLLDKVSGLKDQLQKDDVKPYQSERIDDSPFGNMKVEDCRKEFTFHFDDHDFTKEFKEYDLSNESKFPNVHADYNNNLPLIKLDRNITRLLADLESNGKFRRN
ncbi:MAG TPA: hypothetical protein VKX40_05995 [Aequorivita sp.]|nr:hypothetical protein [Aequorivita sp.]